MPAKGDVIRYLRDSAERLANDYGVTRIGVFGSIVRDESSEDSDLDVLVDMDAPTLDHYMDLKFELEEHFGMPVDLVLSEALKPRLRPIIEREVLYA